MSSVAIAGAGRVAQAMGRLLRERGEVVTAVASRSLIRAEAAAAFIGGGAEAVAYSTLPAHAGHILIAVPDDALPEVAGILARSGMRRGVALHTCGTRGPEVLAPLAAQGVSCGTLHPLQTVASPQQGLSALTGAAFAIDGDAAATAWAGHIAALLGGEPLRVAPNSRPFYHAAAVMASNYAVALLDAAVILMNRAGIHEDTARRALGPLVRESIRNALALGPVAALTGPIERGDAGTVNAHLEALADVPETVRQLYKAAGLQALDIARRRGLEQSKVRRMEELLRESSKRNA
ncbi:MAG: DUF2520 domain-containing protein [Acidobacteria bacterium]|nr:DUF2520 domain-containing protein [Acidobacteriota bacterium]